MERLDIHRLAGQAKLFGTLLGIGGALILNLYKGMKIPLPSMNIHLLHTSNATETTAQQATYNDIWGSILAFLSCASYASWLIFQVGVCVRGMTEMLFLRNLLITMYYILDNRGG